MYVAEDEDAEADYPVNQKEFYHYTNGLAQAIVDLRKQVVALQRCLLQSGKDSDETEEIRKGYNKAWFEVHVLFEFLDDHVEPDLHGDYIDRYLMNGEVPGKLNVQ